MELRPHLFFCLGDRLRLFAYDALKACLLDFTRRIPYVKRLHKKKYLLCIHGAWRSPVARLVRDQEVAGSNPVAPTK
jgi:hypothetical protein